MEEIELSDDIHPSECEPVQSNESRNGGTDQSGRRLLQIVVLTLGLMCILQATLNISLRLAYPSLDSSTYVEANCSEALRSLQEKYNAMKADRERLQDAVSQLSMENALLKSETSGFGEGSSTPG